MLASGVCSRALSDIKSLVIVVVKAMIETPRELYSFSSRSVRTDNLYLEGTLRS
jgi:hypothetical protein